MTTMDFDTYKAFGLDKLVDININGRSRADFVATLQPPEDAVYNPCPEAYPRPGTPEGAISRHEAWAASAVYPGTARDVAVYTTPGLDKSQPANLVIVQDGVSFYLPAGGAVRAAQVFDVMSAKGEMAPTVAIFVNPGRDPQEPEQRSIEYDTMTDRYGRFLLEDLIPFVEKAEGVTLTGDPARRTLIGISSGGICSWTAAWWFPEQFGRVLSHCGSFVNIRGGHNWPFIVRSTERKPIRVFLQSGEHDGVLATGNWPLANRTMADSLEYAGYDMRFEFGVGGHSLRHGGAIFAESLRWLWR